MVHVMAIVLFSIEFWDIHICKHPVNSIFSSLLLRAKFTVHKKEPYGNDRHIQSDVSDLF